MPDYRELIERYIDEWIDEQAEHKNYDVLIQLDAKITGHLVAKMREDALEDE